MAAFTFPVVLAAETATVVPESFYVIAGDRSVIKFSLTGASGVLADYYIGFITPSNTVLTVNPNLQLVEAIAPVLAGFPSVNFAELPLELGPFTEPGEQTTTAALLVNRAGTSVANPANHLALGLAQFVVVDLNPLLGSWHGTWTNTTFGSSGPISLMMTYDSSAREVIITLDIGGNVFGAFDPAPATRRFSTRFGGPTDTLQASGDSSDFGAYTVLVNLDQSTFDFNSTMLAANGHYDLTAVPPTIVMDYTVPAFGAGGSADLVHD
jgi:hypothetical protein